MKTTGEVTRKRRERHDPVAIVVKGKNDYIDMYVGGEAGGFVGPSFIQVTWKIGPNFQQVTLGPDETLALAAWFVEHIKVNAPEIVGVDKD